MRKNINWYLCKLDRISAWTLLATMFIYFISGYGMTKGLFDTRLATQLHNKVLPLVVLTAFSIHTFYAIRLAFKRWQIWDSFGKYLLILVYVIFIAGFLYLHFWYTKSLTKMTTTNVQTQNQEETSDDNDEKVKTTTPEVTTPNQSTTPTTPAKVLTTSVVAQHNSSGDCWIILSSVVYNISSYTHSGPQDHIYCGEDNTSALSSVHGSRYSSYFSSYKVGSIGASY